VGQCIEGLQVHAIDQLSELVAATGVELGLLTVPSEAAQEVADALVAAGIRGILNFAPTVLRLPPHVSMVAVDLAIQLEQLAFLVQWTEDSG
jgi:redox-sensing transcriptional repressor